MRKLLAAFALTLSASAWAATPASGELTDASGPIVFTGGPFVVPNPTSDVNGLAGGPVVCEPMLMNCDEFALTVAIPEKFRKDEKNKKEVVQIALTFGGATPELDAQADFELYILDAAGEPFAESVSGSGAPETVTLPLKQFPDGAYTVRILAYNGLGGSYSTGVRVGRGGKAGEEAAEGKSGDGLLLGAFGWPALFILLGNVLLRRFR
ncbi:MAG: hypothetical protein AABY95_11155 [Pseudomonadota bacterium]